MRSRGHDITLALILILKTEFSWAKINILVFLDSIANVNYVLLDNNILIERF